MGGTGIGAHSLSLPELAVCVLGAGVLGVASSKPGFSPGLYAGVPRLSQLLPFLWEPLGMDGDIILDGDLHEPRELYLYAGSEKYQFRGHGSLVIISRYSVR